MTIKQIVLVIEKITRAYEFEGKSGVSNKLRVLAGTDIFNVKVTPELLGTAEQGKHYEATFEVRTVREEPMITITNLVKK